MINKGIQLPLIVMTAFYVTSKENSEVLRIVGYGVNLSEVQQIAIAQHQNQCFTKPVFNANYSKLKNYCPQIWDGLLCWPPTPPNSSVEIPCYYSSAFEAEKFKGNASRVCESTGVWYSRNRTNESGWTNYTACISRNQTPVPEIMNKWIKAVSQVSLIGYSISFVALIASFIIFISFRRIRSSSKNILHLNLFASFVLKAFFVVLKGFLLKEQIYSLIHSAHSNSEGTSNISVFWCKVVVWFWQYFIIANYSWILMEGMYLHNLIFNALFTDSSSISFYISFGWGAPLLLALVWAASRVFFDDSACWTINNNPWIFSFCIEIPVALSNCFNFFLFLNVTRELFLKLRSSVNTEYMKYRKLGKSTMILVPLFGVHYFLLWGLSTSKHPKVELAWLFLDQVFASFQGFFVAILYCLLNSEVRKEFEQYIRRRNARKFGENHPLNVNCER